MIKSTTAVIQPLDTTLRRVMVGKTNALPSLDQGLVLKKSGFKQSEDLGEWGFSGRLPAFQLDRLEKAGFPIFDDSPRRLVPSRPRLTPGEPSRLPLLPGNEWEMKPVDPLRMTGVDKVRREFGLTGKGVTVAVIDSGIDNPDLKLKAWVDFAEKSPLPVDPSGHGSHVTDDILKTAPGAEIVGIRVADKNGTGNITTILKGIQWAIEHKDEHHIRLINLSMGEESTSLFLPNPLNAAVDKARKAGIAVICAAGNSGPKPGSINTPAEDSSVIAVGSALDEGTVSDFSSRGPNYMGFVKPDLVAPGENIVSYTPGDSELAQDAEAEDEYRAIPREELSEYLSRRPGLFKIYKLPKDLLERTPAEQEQIFKSRLSLYRVDENLVAAAGTSFSAPEVTGMAALLLEADPALNCEELKLALKDNARPIEGVSPNDQGSGMADAYRAVKAVLNRKKEAVYG